MVLGFLAWRVLIAHFIKKHRTSSTLKIKLQRELLQVPVVTSENSSFHVFCLLTRGERGELRDPFPANPPVYYCYASLT